MTETSRTTRSGADPDHAVRGGGCFKSHCVQPFLRIPASPLRNTDEYAGRPIRFKAAGRAFPEPGNSVRGNAGTPSAWRQASRLMTSRNRLWMPGLGGREYLCLRWQGPD